MTDEDSKADLDLSKVEYDEEGRPVQDGYWTVVLMAAVREQVYRYVDATVQPQDFGIIISDINAHWQNIIPWHEIRRVRNTGNSPEYIEAASLFRLNCEHNFVHIHQFPICKNVCSTCGLDKPVEEEHVHAEQDDDS